MNYIKLIEGNVKDVLERHKKQSIGHRYDHFQRVRERALHIARNYPAVDREVLEIAALLHDIDQPYDAKEEHVGRSLEVASQILERAGYEKRKQVLAVIGEHSTESLEEKTSMESKILFDADKIDGLGPVGIARVFAYSGQRGMSIEDAVRWYRKKIRISRENLQTKEGREMFESELKYVEDFLSRVEKDLYSNLR